MLASWIRGNGRRYRPDHEIALWRRIADIGAEEAALRYGDLDGDHPPPDGWDGPWTQLTAELSEIARCYWLETVPEAPGWHFAPPMDAVRNDPEIRRVYWAQAIMVTHGLIMPTVNLADFGLELTVTSLRAAIWADLGQALARSRPYRRCARCDLWFSPTRTDARLCGAACTQANYEERRTAALISKSKPVRRRKERQLNPENSLGTSNT
jgi:hypothetical protein